ncbi:OsmC family protein [Vibrio lentus]|uniref:Osmotically inducible protein OsmC n=1 Tax=Vibrio lentus TaxID=136468 RepID=A0AB36XK17_9VIBR|nr:OsmC family protein [Vibrio lentus]MCC4835493.1 OsmC family protein [Vibrio lentus]PMI13424.1 osmotically inducible protein OsmC [Vibrio lentus]PMK38228.1 osmotically inducible protein OsmC [Vibrio lentus]PMK45312.1 osmotically inducible protein OsmC [Vibrio lentus]PML34487.1 osmotically inducible protein OsmC [Vibrio lentus]
MSLNVKWGGECQFKVTTEGGFNFDIDATSNQAPCPTEVLLSALGACSATDVVFILQEKGFEISGLENNVTHTLTDEEPRLYKSANLHFSVQSRGISESDILTAAQEAVLKHCHVCLMLQPKIDITCSAEVIAA